MLEFLSVLGLLLVAWSVWYGCHNMPRHVTIDYQKHDDLLRSLTPVEKTAFASVREATEHVAELPNGSKMSMRQVRYWS